MSELKSLIEDIKNDRITNVMLSGDNKIGDEEIKSIAEAFKYNKSITSLYLSYSQIGNAGAIAIAEALKENKSITHFNLSNNKIEDAGAIAIAEALKENKSIIYLNLYNNQIGDAGAEAIARAIKINKCVTFFDLSFNKIEDKGTIALFEALKENRSITSLRLSNKYIGYRKDEGEKSTTILAKVNENNIDKLCNHLLSNKRYLSKSGYELIENIDEKTILYHVEQKLKEKLEVFSKEEENQVKNMLRSFGNNFMHVTAISKQNLSINFRDNKSLAVPQEIQDYVGSYLKSKDILATEKYR